MRSRDRQRNLQIINLDLPRRHKPDYWLLALTAILLAIGLVVIYAISPGLSLSANTSSNYYINRQLISVAIGLAAFFVVANMPLTWWRWLQAPLIITAIISAVAVRAVGQQINGAYRWIQIGGISFQSAELIKIALLIWLAGFLAVRIKSSELSNNGRTLWPIILVLFVIVAVVTGLQSDLGSTGVMVAMMVAMAYVAGLPLKRFAVFGSIIVFIAAIAVLSTPYRRSRVITFLHPTSDCLSTGYQACQALIAVGSGGMVGLGLGRSVQAYGYLPEPANDSIFAIIGEKFGFIGSVILLGLLATLFTRIKNIIVRAPNDFTRLIVVGILVWLSVQTIINIGAMIGLLPLKGITLPFISYGGTSVVFVMMAMGLVFQISHYTTYTARVPKLIKGRIGYDDRPDGRRLRGAYNPAISGRQ